MTTARELAARRAMEKPIPEPLLARRLALNLTLRDVAGAIGIALSYYNKLESGGSEPGVRVAMRLARFYETTVEDLFGYLLDEEAQP